MVTRLYSIVEKGDALALLLCIALLCWLGQKTVAERPRLQRADFVLAVTAFVAFCADHLLRTMATDAWDSCGSAGAASSCAG